MSDNLPFQPSSSGPPARGDSSDLPVTAPSFRHVTAGGTDEEEQGMDLGRMISAILRYKWAILALVVVGTAAGVLFARGVRPAYVAQATIWIETAGQQRVDQGPIQTEGLLESAGWLQLLRSYVVLDHVVREHRLYLNPAEAADSTLFASFQLAERFLPGSYVLEVAEDGASYQLIGERELVLESGAPGDSIGTELGFVWAPPAGLLSAGRSVEFTVLTPRDAAIWLAERLDARLPELHGSFLRLELTGSNAERTAATLNAIAERFVQVAADLKRDNSEELTSILEEQLVRAADNLDQAEIELEAFRVQTITLPSETSSPVAPGIESTRDPAFQSFFSMRIEREQIRQDMDAIQATLEAQQREGITPGERLWTVGAVQQSSDLRQALTDLTNKQAELRTLRARFTDEHPDVARLASEVRTLETVAIPSLARTLLGQLAERERSIGSLIDSASDELRAIPPRMIEEARLRRRVTIAEALYSEVQSRYEAARLAAVSSIPDVRILDQATVPHTVTNPSAKKMAVVFAFLGSLGLGIAGAVLRDRLDRRFRYPEQVTTEMGLPILGAIQMAPGGNPSEEGMDQVLEAFRELRLGVMNAYGTAGPVVLAVTSPGSGDGKSFVSSNLALAFADLGYRTLIIDGDIRRGTMHHLMNGTRKPGLTDYLAGELPLEGAVQTTQYTNLDFIGAGAWRRSGPELLASPRMRSLIATMRTRYQVIVVDTSPLGAGVDPYVVATVTGSLIMVLRTGTTDRDLAGAKLDVLQRLPIRVLGAVLNAVPARGAYKYYSYISSYQLPPGADESEAAV